MPNDDWHLVRLAHCGKGAKPGRVDSVSGMAHPWGRKMDTELQRQIELHSAGATVLHAGAWSNLEVPSTMKPLEESIIAKWVAPFYMWGIRRPN